MTTLATRTDTSPAVIDGDLTITHPAIGTIAPGDLQYVPVVDRGPNPHRVHAIASALLMGGAGLGAGWSVIQGYAHTGLSAGAFLLTIAVFALVIARFNAWERG